MRSMLRRGATGLAALVVAMFAGVILPVSPAHAAWGHQIPVTIQVERPIGYSGATESIGRAEGWVQFDGVDSFRFNLTICRQSSYSLPRLYVSVNRHLAAQGYVSTPLQVPPTNWTSMRVGGPGECYQDVGTVSAQYTYPGLRDVYFVLESGTFVGYTFTTFTQDRWVWEEV